MTEEKLAKNLNRKTFAEIGEPIQQFVLPLIAKVDDIIEGIGTGFIINPNGLFVTASHVLVQAHDCGVRRMGATGFYNHYEFYALYANNQMAGEGSDLFGGLLPVENIWAPIDLDIGYGQLKLPIHKETGNPIPTMSARLRAAIPEVGEIVTAVGYLAMCGTCREENGSLDIEFKMNTAVVSGKVVEVKPVRRDSGLLSFPCFRVDAEYDHGMSGGPIFDASGRVCGVVCSGADWNGGSWGSLIWPLFGSEIERRREAGGPLEKALLYDLAKEGSILTDESFNRVTVERLENGHRTAKYRGI
jgi:hypothetical protein